MSKFVPHGPVAQSSELKNESSKATTWHEDAYAFSSLLIERLLIQFLLEVVVYFIDEGCKALIALKGAQD